MTVNAPATEKILLSLIQTFLKTFVTENDDCGIDADNIYLAVDEDIIPLSVETLNEDDEPVTKELTFPAIGIKEKDTVYEQADQGGQLITQPVVLIIIQEIEKGDDYALGTVLEAKDGLLGFRSVLRGALMDNKLDASKIIIESALPVSATEITEFIGEDNFHVLTTKLTIEYKIWEDKIWQD